MKIYTKTGDTGETSLYDNSRVSKSSKVISVIGTIDELIAHLGLCGSNNQSLMHTKIIIKDVITGLMDANAVIANATTVDNSYLFERYTYTLESAIDIITKDLPTLTRFTLPIHSSTWYHNINITRTVCRRAERKLVKLKTLFQFGYRLDSIVKFLNRLSDYLFTLLRMVGCILNKEPEEYYVTELRR